jgi:hypothetical protein
MPRHALGLPAGSIRALLAFLVLGLLWLLVLTPGPGGLPPLKDQRASLVFIYLQTLMVLILASFFAAHGSSIGSRVSRRSPLGLPRGSVRFLLLAGYLGLAIYLYQAKLEFEFPPTGLYVVWMLVLISGFFLGHVITGMVRFMSGGTLPAWFQDIQAWVALLAMMLLGIIAIVHLVINTSLPMEGQLDMPTVEAVLAGLVGLYFGARS